MQHIWKIHLACGPLLAIPFPTSFKRQRQIAGDPFFWLQPISHLFQSFWAPSQHVLPLQSHAQGWLPMAPRKVYNPSRKRSYASQIWMSEKCYPLESQVKNRSYFNKKLIPFYLRSLLYSADMQCSTIDQVKWKKSSDKSTTYQTWQLALVLFCH